MRPPPHKPLLNPQQHRYVLVSIFVTGAAALLLEIVGTRLISPYYGSSIYCWSALITVTLVALAAGYNIGGRWADGAPSPTLFARLVCFSGATVAVIPVLREPVLRATTPCGIQLGALASATILVAPSLILLSTLGPLTIRLTTQAVNGVGRSSGDVYAVSTLGSVAGALLAGFVLVPHVPISQILYGLAVLLLVLGAIGYHLSREKIPLAAPAAAAAAALMGFWPRAVPATNIVYNGESPYGQIKVMDFGDRRYLLINGTTQSMVLLKTMRTDSQYSEAMETAALIRPRAKRGVVVGVGAGLLISDLESFYGLTVDGVDVDQRVVSVARRWFGFHPKGQVFIEDGRTFLEKEGSPYDLVFFDAFSPEAPPYHLFTRESFEAAKGRLAPGGVLAINLVSLVRDGHDEAWRSTLKTLRTVFGRARAFQASEAYDGIANVVFLCSDGPLDVDLAAIQKRARPEIRDNLRFMAQHELEPDAVQLDSAALLTDDHAPLESMLAETSVRWRRMLQDKIDTVLLY